MTKRLRILAPILGFAILSLTACATMEGYRQKMDLLVGRSADSILLDWGAPRSKERLSDGSEMWVFSRESENRSGGYTSYNTETRQRTRQVKNPDGTMRTETYTDSYQVPYYVPLTVTYSHCETRFVMQDGKVKQVAFEGDGCVAEEMAKPAKPAE